MKGTFSFLLILWFLPQFSLSQSDSLLELIVGEVQSITFDKETFDRLKVQDSLRIEQWKRENPPKHDTSLNGSIITIGPPKAIFMRRPYLVDILVKKQFTNGEIKKHLTLRVWSHFPAKFRFEEPYPYAFVLQQIDSSGIYSCHSSYTIFKTWWGAYAEPVVKRDKIYRMARKPLFNYKLLKEKGSTHYQLLKDEVECCMDQLEKLYLN